MAVKPIPDGYHSVTPYLICDGAAAVIDFAKKAFGAEETFRMEGPPGRISHAEFRVGNSIIMIADSNEQMQAKAMPAMLHLYVEDSDATFKAAVEAGGTVVREMETQFYGDRSGGVLDPAGNQWYISSHVEDVSPEEMDRRIAEMRAQMQG